MHLLCCKSRAIALRRKWRGWPNSIHAFYGVSSSGISSKSKRIKNAAIKALTILSEESPELLYPHFDTFAELLESPDNILKWNATFVLANMAGVDSGQQLEGNALRKYLGLFRDECMITAANAVKASGKIALAKPRLVPKLTQCLLGVETVERNAECRNILVGCVLTAFGEFRHLIKDKNAVLEFARGHLKNRRPATAKKAATLVAQIEKARAKAT